MARTSTASTRIATVLLCCLFAAGAWRIASQSISTAEALTFDRFVWPPLRDSLPHFDPASLLLNTVLVKRSVGLLRLSEFSFRLPNLLGMALYLWAIYRICRRLFGSGPGFLAATVLLSLNPLVLAGAGLGLGLGLWTEAACQLSSYLHSKQTDSLYHLNLAGMCLGLATAASLCFLVPSVLLVVGFVPVAVARARPAGTMLIERLALTAVVVGFLFLGIPLARAQTLAAFWEPDPHSYRPWQPDSEARLLVQALRRDAGDRQVRIGASATLDPVITFYRARYRLASWAPMRQLPLSGEFDYYVCDGSDRELAATRHFEVLWHNPHMLLARRSHDGTRP